MNNLMRLEQVSRIFGKEKTSTIAVNEVTLGINEGESIAIVGESGSGKSTLLSIIGLLDHYNEGNYYLKETDVKTLTRAQKSIIRNKHIGWVFQNFSLINSLSATENVCLPLRFNAGVSKKDYLSLSQKALERVGLSNKYEALPEQLSGGQQQRVAIARAIVANPSLILADEPTGNLDSANSDDIFDLLLSLCDLGTTLVVVTHSERLANRCMKQFRMKDGSLVNDTQ